MEEPLTDELRDIKPPLELPADWAWLWWLVLVGVVVVGVFLLWRGRRRRVEAVPAVPAVPPHVRARRRLERAMRLLGQPRPFTVQVSDAVRVYLEERFALHAPERTTEEFLHEIQDATVLEPEQKARLSEFLSRCDLVKFARYEPGEEELLALHRAAVRLIDETEPAVEAHEARQM